MAIIPCPFFHIFHGWRKLKYLIDNLHCHIKARSYEHWMYENFVVMRWVWHSMEPHMTTKVEFCYSSKMIWNSIAKSFS